MDHRTRRILGVVGEAHVVGVHILVYLFLDDSQVSVGSQVVGHRGLAVPDKDVLMTGEQ